jgi:rhodanese-related sulfurtransferase
MPHAVDRATLERLQQHEQGLVINVLSSSEYHKRHIPDSINIPLRQLTKERVEKIDLDRPLVTYCKDEQCDLSERAANLLEQYGFSNVGYYKPGEVGWFGEKQSTSQPEPGKGPYASDLVERDAPVCWPEDTVRSVRDRLRTDGLSGCAVVNEDRIVLGEIGERELKKDGLVHEVMNAGADTYRPIIPVEKLLLHMRRSGLAKTLISENTGRLIGTISRAQIEAALRQHEPSPPTGRSANGRTNGRKR